MFYTLSVLTTRETISETLVPYHKPTRYGSPKVSSASAQPRSAPRMAIHAWPDEMLPAFDLLLGGCLPVETLSEKQPHGQRYACERVL